MKKISSGIFTRCRYLFVFIFLLCAVIIIGGYLVFQNTKNAPKERIIFEARDNMVLYSDGTAEIIWNDDTPDGVMHRYSTVIESIKNPGKQPSLPVIKQTVGSWERIQFLYDDTENQPCLRHILHIDRVHKTSNLSTIDYCIVQTLDEHDFTHFLAISFDNKNMEVGNYSDGKIIAKHEIPDFGISGDFHNGGVHNVLPNWEVSKIAFIGGGCDDREQTGLKVYLWDLEKNTIEDQTPVGLKCESFRGLEYDRGSDTFSVALPWMTDDSPRSLPLRSSQN